MRRAGSFDEFTRLTAVTWVSLKMHYKHSQRLNYDYPKSIIWIYQPLTLSIEHGILDNDKKIYLWI